MVRACVSDAGAQAVLDALERLADESAGVEDKALMEELGMGRADAKGRGQGFKAFAELAQEQGHPETANRSVEVEVFLDALCVDVLRIRPGRYQSGPVESAAEVHAIMAQYGPTDSCRCPDDACPAHAPL